MTTATRNELNGKWVKVLSKGLITIPKDFRRALDIKEGEVARIKKIGRRLVVESRDVADYEVYSDKEFKQMLADDKLTPNLANQAALLWPDLA